jgi:DNA-binding response OmpR family regulator
MEVTLSERVKILIVDDEPNILIAIDFLLSRQGFEVIKANDGHEALELLYKIKPQIIILDVMMPEIDGFEVARRIRNSDVCNDAHIIFLTAKGAEKDRWEGYNSGAEIYLTKPFDNDKLINIVNEMAAYG